MMCGIAFRVIFIIVCICLYTSACDFAGCRIVIKYISGQRDLNSTFMCFCMYRMIRVLCKLL
jgi:hypothetical protein